MSNVRRGSGLAHRRERKQIDRESVPVVCTLMVNGYPMIVRSHSRVRAAVQMLQHCERVYLREQAEQRIALAGHAVEV